MAEEAATADTNPIRPLAFNETTGEPLKVGDGISSEVGTAEQATLDKAHVAEAERFAPAIISDDKLQSGPISLEPGGVHGGSLVADPPREIPAAARLRAFEDEHLGKDAVRIRGQIERGSGSPYQDPKVMTPELRRQHAALEKLVIAEQKLADAHVALIQAEADHEAALAAAEPKPDAAE